MIANWVEYCRKMAKLPAFANSKVTTESGKFTQEQFFRFVDAVRSVGEDANVEVASLKDRIQVLSDKLYAKDQRIGELERANWEVAVGDGITKVAGHLQLPKEDTNELLGVVNRQAS